MCPFTRVYAGTLPLGYQLEQFLRWGYGPAAGLLSIVGIALLLGLAIRTRSTTAIVLGSWFGVYGAVLLLADVKFLRYLSRLRRCSRSAPRWRYRDSAMSRV